MSNVFTYSAQEGEETEFGPVLPKCDDKQAQGHWYCITHKESFAHNFAMQSHTEHGKHVIAWICHPHGPEVP